MSKLTLWATTRAGRHKIKIYIDPELTGYWGECVQEGAKTPFISLAEATLKDPARLDQILVHEFVHALEYLYARELAKADPKDCTRYAMVLGRFLPEMLTRLVQEGQPARTASSAVHTSSCKRRHFARKRRGS